MKPKYFFPFASCLKFAEGYYVNADVAVTLPSLCFYRILLGKEGSVGFVSRDITIVIFNIIYLHTYSLIYNWIIFHISIFSVSFALSLSVEDYHVKNNITARERNPVFLSSESRLIVVTCSAIISSLHDLHEMDAHRTGRVSMSYACFKLKSYCTDFHEMLYWRILQRCVEPFTFLFTSGMSNDYFTWRPRSASERISINICWRERCRDWKEREENVYLLYTYLLTELSPSWKAANLWNFVTLSAKRKHFRTWVY
jgi:hypothetical protein